MAKINELILVAAPSCCGKTHFLENLASGQLQDLQAAVGIEAAIDSYVSVIPRQLAPYRDTVVPRMILHYALPTIALNDGSLRSLTDDHRLEIIKSAERLKVITLVASANVLASRLRRRYFANLKMIFFNYSSYLSDRQRMKQLKPLYAEPRHVIVTYETWFQYIQALPNLQKACLVTAEDGYEVFDFSRWPEIRDAYFPVTNQDT